MPTVATREPQNPATIAPTNVAVMTTGPGLIIPIATATRNCRSSSQPVARVHEEGDHGRTHAIENGGHWREPAEMHVEETEHRDDHEVRQDEGPPFGPGSPEATAQVGDENPHLNGQGTGHGLTHCN